MTSSSPSGMGRCGYSSTGLVRGKWLHGIAGDSFPFTPWTAGDRVRGTRIIRVRPGEYEDVTDGRGYVVLIQ